MIETPAILVQTARQLGYNWTLQPWRLIQMDDQLGSLGPALFWTAYGSVIDDTIGLEEVRGAPSISSLDGYLVRVLVADPAGSSYVASYPGESWTAVWHGKVKAVELAPTGNGGGTARIEAIEVGALLRDLALNRGAQLQGDGTTPWTTAHIPPFNHISTGDRSSGTVSIVGATVHVHDLTNVTGQLWTARQIIDHVIALNWPTADIPLAVVDPDGCLAYTPPSTPADGKTLWDLVDQLANASRGLVWWVQVNGSGLDIHVRSTTDTAITVDTYTLPANSLTDDLVTDANTINVALTSLAQDVADEIEVVGARPEVIVTLNLQSTSTTDIVPDGVSSLTKGWSSGASSAWATWSANPRSNLPPATADGAWTRYELRPTWLGAQAPTIAGAAASNGLPNTYATASDSSHGDGGLTGVASYTSGSTSLPSAWSLQGLPSMPASLGFGTLRIGQRQPPVVVIGTGSTWFDMSSSWRVKVESSPPAIAIDDGEGGAAVRARLLDGWRLFVTVALTGWEPLTVSWLRTAGDCPLSAIRSRRIHVPSLGWDLMLDQTVTGVNDDTGFGTDVVRRSGDMTIRNDLPAMLRLLAYFRGWYESPSVIASWTQRGVLERSATRRPGALLLTVDDGDTVHDTAAVITRRTVRLVDVADAQVLETSYQTDIIVPDIEAIL